jgi:flavin reductase (DIM6/NTAB) family NADH-FMN oxidoreductase RutF
MLTINPNNLTERENYKFLIGSIIPRPIAFVTSINEEGVVNAAPFSFFNIVSSNPPLISVSVQRKAGEMKDTARNITANKEFVVHVVSEPFVAQINETAANLPPNESELTRANLTAIESTFVKVPGVKEAKVRFECKLEKHLPLGGNDEAVGCDLLIGRVVAYHIDEAIYEDGKIDLDGLAAMSRLAGNDYANVGKVTTIERPQ